MSYSNHPGGVGPVLNRYDEQQRQAEKDALPKTPGAGKVEAAGIEPARHSLPNPANSSDFAQEAT